MKIAHITIASLILVSTVLIAWCSKSTTKLTLNTWDIVLVDYVGTFDDGKVFDTSIEAKAKEAGIYQEGRTYQPLQVTLWKGMVIPGFEKAISSLTTLWETKTIKLKPEEWYGPSDPNKIWSAPLAVFTKANIVPKVWESFTHQGMNATVIAISGDTVTLDANHPMAGKILNFEITLKEIRSYHTWSIQ